MSILGFARTFIGIAVMLPAIARSQAPVTGVVTDPVMRRAVPGAVVSVIDARGSMLARTITDDSGRFRLSAPSDGQRLRVVKLGYRPAVRSLTQDAQPLAIALERLPNLLEPVRTLDQPKCPRHPTRAAAFGLWEQARAALLGSVIARESNIAEVTRINFHRTIEARTDEVVRQSVRRETAHALRSFDAVLSAAEFATRGFAVEEAGRRIQFYGPDAEVLLDDAFPNSYCLELAPAQRTRAAQVGLRFRPMTEQMRRVDLDGTLWVDTAARVISDIEFRYLGLERWADSRRPGGALAFREISPGVLWIEEWMLRMTGARIRAPVLPAIQDYDRPSTLVEGGAALASVRWPDGRAWDATLGEVEIRLVSGTGSPVAGASLQLDSTDYVGTSDSTGTVRIPKLFPGPYTISVFDAALAVVDTMLPTATRFVAIRDSLVRVKVRVPSLAEFVKWGCTEQAVFDKKSAALVVRIESEATRKPVPYARWEVLRTGVTSELKPLSLAKGMTGVEGLVFLCKDLEAGQRLILRAWTLGAEDKATEVAITPGEQVLVMKVVLRP